MSENVASKAPGIRHKSGLNPYSNVITVRHGIIRNVDCTAYVEHPLMGTSYASFCDNICVASDDPVQDV